MDTFPIAIPTNQTKVLFGARGNFIKLENSVSGLLPVKIKTYPIGETKTFFDFGEGIRFDNAFESIEVESPQAGDVVSLSIGFGLIIPAPNTTQVSLNVPQPLKVQGPYAIGQADPGNVLPVITGNLQDNGAGGLKIGRTIQTENFGEVVAFFQNFLRQGNVATLTKNASILGQWQENWAYAAVFCQDSNGQPAFTGTLGVTITLPNIGGVPQVPKVLDSAGAAVVNTALVKNTLYYVNCAMASSIVVAATLNPGDGNPDISIITSTQPPPFKFF